MNPVWVFGGGGTGFAAASWITEARKIEVQTSRTNLFSMAIACINDISMSGGAIIDSFDSSSSTYSTGGHYDATKREANAACRHGFQTTTRTHILVDSRLSGAYI